MFRCLAIKLGIQAFHTYLTGWTFTIETDHQLLEYKRQQCKADMMESIPSRIPCSSWFDITLESGTVTNADAQLLPRTNLDPD